MALKPLNGNDTPVVIFLHLPKASGSTLNAIIQQQYRPDEMYQVGAAPRAQTIAELQAMSGERLARLKIITGHAPFGLHAFVPKPCRYITILRDPVERVLSHYYFALRTPRHHAHAGLVSGEVSMRQYVEMRQNDQTRYIAGWTSEIGTSTEGGGVALLDAAKANLMSHFVVTGMTERFDESLVLLKRTLGWRIRPYRNANVTGQRPKRAATPPDVLQVIQENNRLDIALYEFVRTEFEHRVRKEGAGFGAEVAGVRWMNMIGAVLQRLPGRRAGRAK